MKKGVVILIIIGTLCYFGIQWYSGKYQEGSKFNPLVAMSQWAFTKGDPEPEIIYEKDIILKVSKEKEASDEATFVTPLQGWDSGVKGRKSGVKAQDSGPKTKDTRRIIELVKLYLKEGKKYEARNTLSDAYFTETSEAKRKQIKERLDKLNEELVFSPNPSKDADIYVVKPGDTLIKIAKRYNTSYELIMRLNKKQRTHLKVNERLKVLRGKVSLLADKSDFTLTVLMDDHYIKQYSVGTGVAGKTPVGTFKINSKLKNPVWYSPEGVYKHGHPKNILGTRWIGFEDKPGLSGYGIHGTTLPDTIGKEASMGCIRMINKDAEELYDFVVLGTKVMIQE
ncbi:MAG: L,D-transpeptidase family protein [Candidatus Brocadiales bacterium]